MFTVINYFFRNVINLIRVDVNQAQLFLETLYGGYCLLNIWAFHCCYYGGDLSQVYRS